MDRAVYVLLATLSLPYLNLQLSHGHVRVCHVISGVITRFSSPTLLSTLSLYLSNLSLYFTPYYYIYPCRVAA
jgi:hypothetical protein